ncbi:hypothetical protein BD410DRAFT_712974 [Rickenella mellea]|uniref:RRM domain-containing protein n=1 Tax=Rickenella mellea TaxID=50990 RepID=A0A4Y7QKN4_9AGAM|nr:hypothetical protein BD410DRAFT_712974 [Rickenella mellea]
MSESQKLTKKQKKGLVFRQKKGKSKEGRDDNLDVPVVENLDVIESVELSQPDHPPEISAKATAEPAAAAKKRKIDDIHAGLVDAAGKELSKRKKQKKDAEDSATDDKQHDGVDTRKSGQQSTTTSRFILFVGNLKYTTSKEAILQHFAACDPPPTVRLLTPKSGSTSKSKGCAFLEFTHRNALQQGLKLHQSELEGRRINVELTAGGGGKSETRINKVKERNRQLAVQRKTVMQKKQSKDGVDEPVVERPQRHSRTSGLEEIPLKKRTWTVGDADDHEKHRGGKKHAKGSKTNGRKTKDWSTGVNAIPVG